MEAGSSVFRFNSPLIKPTKAGSTVQTKLNKKYFEKF